MFLENSRYANVPTDTVTTRDGPEVTALRLRPLPPTTGRPQTVIEGDRLDVLAERHFGDGTRFWHIADANTELVANDLLARVLDRFNLPEK
ncbi:hypothetical protein [Pararhodobacter sp. SW119]|uniref:hypothetical protein n=1 Tax=Pararhodobacter sp. SW119 TaxID=2780075 RepID=UPI001ADF5F44|nr:hypothetical protein [Pararhodobacter sp. SW119]